MSSEYVIREPVKGVWTERSTEEHICAQLDDLARHSFTGKTFPIAVKDNIAVAGLTRSAGSEALRGEPETADAQVVSALKAHGAVVVGMTNMHELAFGITSNNAVYRPVGLPGVPDRGAGGSSGGSAAAIRDGSVEIALGRDTGGSVSIPASHCGVYSFRPSTGRWSNAGVVGLSWTRDTLGVFAKELEQLKQVDSLVTNSGSGKRPVEQLRLGVPRQFLDNLDPHVEITFERELSKLQSLHIVEIVDYSDVLDQTRPAESPIVGWESVRLLSAEAANRYETTLRDGPSTVAGELRSQDVREIVEGLIAKPVTADQYADAQRRVAIARMVYSQLMRSKELDALIFPTVPAPAPPLDVADATEHLGRKVSTFELYTSHTGQGTILGAPMVTVPMGVEDGELPVGLTVQGPRFADEQTLEIATEVDSRLRPLRQNRIAVSPRRAVRKYL